MVVGPATPASLRPVRRTGIDAGVWSNSAAIDGDPLAWVTTSGDIVVIGSLSLVHALAAADLVDEYRLITFPTVVGEGDRLFATGRPTAFRFTSVEPADAAALSVLRRLRGKA